jgi:hypothetical protein
MLASRASHSGRTLTLENPLIVNGMQTSYEVHSHFSETGATSDSRNILIRVVGVSETPDELESRNRIIKATNSQTTIQIASLRATDRIQRDIEEYLLSKGYYYDRRKNFYKNQRKPLNQIVSITYLAQSVISLVLKRPNDARARPSTLLREDEEYAKIFSPDYPMTIYDKCIDIMKCIESYLRTKFPGVASTIINNYKFHLAMFATLLAVNNPEATVGDIIGIDLVHMNREFLDSCYAEVDAVYTRLGEGAYTASKSRQSVENSLKRLREVTYQDNR